MTRTVKKSEDDSGNSAFVLCDSAGSERFIKLLKVAPQSNYSTKHSHILIDLNPALPFSTSFNRVPLYCKFNSHWISETSLKRYTDLVKNGHCTDTQIYST